MHRENGGVAGKNNDATVISAEMMNNTPITDANLCPPPVGRSFCRRSAPQAQQAVSSLFMVELHSKHFWIAIG